MELEIMYPEIITFSAIIVTIIFFLRVDKKYKKGIIVANTKYVKNTSYYQKIMIRYRTYKILINILCIVLIILCAVLSSRFYSLYKVGEEVSNRDIMLCMDISGSVNNLNTDLVETMKETVKTLKNERIGITVFDSMPYSVVPLTTDYTYVVYMLNQIGNALKTKYNPFEPNNSSFVRDFLYSGVQNTSDEGRGYSLVGDGLAYCASSFKKDDNRTKIIILTTDNEVVGNQIVTVSEAASYCRDKKIRVYSVGTKEIFEDAKKELINVSKYTNGKYYDYSNYDTKEIAKEIESLHKNAIVKSNFVYTKDYPETIIYIILVILPCIFLLDWRVRI